MFKLHRITVFICVTSVLTLSVNGTEMKGSSKETGIDPIEHLFHDPGGFHFTSKAVTKSETNLSNDTSYASPTATLSGLIHQAETTNSSIIDPKIAPTEAIVAEGIKLTSKDLATADLNPKFPKIRNASVVARKGAILPSKISPRKGVGLESLIPKETSMEGIDEALHTSVSTVNIPNKKLEQVTARTDLKNDMTKAKTEQKYITEYVSIPVSPNNNATKININSTKALQNVNSTIVMKISNVPVASSTPPLKRFKPKPTVTIGKMDIDKPIPASPTKTPPLGMPRKIDYIVPVIITIMALPLVGTVAFFLYRKGRDCWDKRHYRRMDFLIDGMYNDYSWK